MGQENMKIRKANKKDADMIMKLNSQLSDYHAKIDRYYKTGKEINKGFKKHLGEIIGKRNYQQDAYYYDENEGVGIVCDGIGSNVNSHIFAENFTKAFAQFLQNKNEKISDRDYEVFISKFKSDFTFSINNASNKPISPSS